MTTPNMIGDADGVKLWNMIATSNDAGEKEYFISLNNAASKYGVAWFYDSVTQRNTKMNQTSWKMEWDNKTSQWKISLFHIPEGVKKVSERIASFGQKPVELNFDDIIF
ncbi:hypothetical protein LCGC14_2225740 [marine sediment metagenome]|uniref:Uncharacterized protein n=1 Tax=marine sediment metagenome TaxID=412755 RepID=A0A0F9D9S8_9ZZZZ